MAIRKATASPEAWAKHLEYHRLRYHADADKHREKRREYSAREGVKRRRRERDHTAEAIAKRRSYAKNEENKARARERYKERFEKDPDFRIRRNISNRMIRTGFDHILVVALLEKQGNRCAICQTSFTDRRMCADHCHTTGKPRGLLCHQCNIIEGMMSRTGLTVEEFAHRLVAYLECPPALTKQYGLPC